MIKIKNLWFRYRDSDWIFKDFNLYIDSPNRVVFILGPNGVGKTTLLKLIAGLLKPTKGYIEVLGFKPHRMNRQCVARSIGIAFQEPQLQLFLDTVEDELSITCRVLGISEDECRDRVDYLLNIFNLDNLRKRHPHTLSYGEKRLLSIAIALMSKPKILLLDEPTAGLDGKYFEIFKNVLRELYRDRVLIVIATHDMDLLFELQLPMDIYVLSRKSLYRYSEKELLGFIENKEIAALSQWTELIKALNTRLSLFNLNSLELKSAYSSLDEFIVKSIEVLCSK